MISPHDRNILRKLAGRVREIAEDPVQHERRQLWYKINRLERCRIPMTLKNDREAISLALRANSPVQSEDARLAIIPNTLNLSEMYVTENLAEGFEVMTEPVEMSFDEEGNLQMDLRQR